MSTICETIKYDVVEVTFNNGNYGLKTYYYKMHASMKPTVGDVVIVDSPSSGLVTVTVRQVYSKNAHHLRETTKWVVDKVDCRFYRTLLAAEKERQQARENAALMATRVNNVEQLMLSLPTGSKARKLLAQAVKAL